MSRRNASVKIPLASHGICQRPASGSVAAEPEDLRSENGVLKLGLTVRSSVDADGRVRYCYLAKDGSEAPNIRVKPGDWLILSLKNEIELPPTSPSASASMKMNARGKPTPGACTKTEMTPLSTNLHFHGLTVPPVCHQDDVMKTMIQAGDKPFEYRFQIPPNEAPGLYWYHPHVHGLTSAQVLGGASGALIVEGIERANRQPRRRFH
jgi:FtsP/CotA-like multicopper oxidase with cupredoxin domain